MLINHSLIYLLSRIIPGVFALIALSLYSHLLSPYEYGIYSLLLSVSVFTHNLLIDWLSSGTLRFWPDPKFNEKEFINTLFYILKK